VHNGTTTERSVADGSGAIALAIAKRTEAKRSDGGVQCSTRRSEAPQCLHYLELNRNKRKIKK